MEVSSTDTVRALKAKLEDAADVPAGLQRLFYKGTLLDDGRRITEYNIQENSVVQLLVQLRGQVCVPAVKCRGGTLLAFHAVVYFTSASPPPPAPLVFSDERGCIPFAPFTPVINGETVVSFARPVAGTLRCDAEEMDFAEAEDQAVSAVDKCTGRAIAEVLLPAAPIGAKAWLADATARLRRTFGYPVDGVEVLRVPGDWQLIQTDDDLFHPSNTNRIAPVVPIRVVVRLGDSSTKDVHVPRRTTLAAAKVFLKDVLRGPVPSLRVVFDGPEYLASPMNKKEFAISSEAEWAAVFADGVVLSIGLPTNATPFSSMCIPRVPVCHDASASKVLDTRAWGDAGAPETLAFFRENGWVIVRHLFELPEPPKSYFDKPLSDKQANAIQPAHRTWGWHHMSHQGTEILKIRDVESMHNEW